MSSVLAPRSNCTASIARSISSNVGTCAIPAPRGDVDGRWTNNSQVRERIHEKSPSILKTAGVALTVSVTPSTGTVASARRVEYTTFGPAENGDAVSARGLLESHLPLIDRVIAHVCRRQRLRDDESDDFAGLVRLKLIENDYAILRKYEGRSSIETFMSVVVQRLLLDYRVQLWGKWHASAQAKRIGSIAVDLERLIHRDRQSIEQSTAILKARYPHVTQQSVAALLDRLPQRSPRFRDVALDAAHEVAEDADGVIALDVRRASDRISRVVNEFIGGLPPRDRLILRLRFENDMTVAEIE